MQTCHMRYEFRKQNIWIIRIRTVQLQLRLLYFTPLIKNRFKISGYCFLLIIPPIFTPLFITRMNYFDHLNTLGSSLFFYQNVNVFIKRILWEAQFYCCHFCQVDDMEDSVIFNWENVSFSYFSPSSCCYA